MNQIATFPQNRPQTQAAQASIGSAPWESVVGQPLGNGRYRLECGAEAICTLSCVIVPEAGDQVLCISGADQRCYILAIVHRQQAATARLSVPGCDNLQIFQPNIQCRASRQIDLGSLEGIKLTSARGNIEMRAINLVQTLVGSIIESAKERISSADFIQFCSGFLTRFHSRQTLMTAESDIKIDADRVNLG